MSIYLPKDVHLSHHIEGRALCIEQGIQRAPMTITRYVTVQPLQDGAEARVIRLSTGEVVGVHPTWDAAEDHRKSLDMNT